MSNDNTCATCRFFVPDFSGDMSMGVCRRHAPAPLVRAVGGALGDGEPQNEWGFWPAVFGIAWCGEWTARGTAPAPAAWTQPMVAHPEFATLCVRAQKCIKRLGRAEDVPATPLSVWTAILLDTLQGQRNCGTVTVAEIAGWLKAKFPEQTGGETPRQDDQPCTAPTPFA